MPSAPSTCREYFPQQQQQQKKTLVENIWVCHSLLSLNWIDHLATLTYLLWVSGCICGKKKWKWVVEMLEQQNIFMAINGIGTLPSSSSSSSSKMASNPLFINKNRAWERHITHWSLLQKHAANYYHKAAIEGHNGQFMAESMVWHTSGSATKDSVFFMWYLAAYA